MLRLTHDTVTFYVRPFRSGMGPTFRFDFTPYSDGTMHVDVHLISGRKAGERICIFDSDGYRPGVFARTARQWAEDVVGFALAYVERPAEFARRPTDPEQVNAAAWNRYGDALACALAPKS